ncbi:hypothetical protein G4V62_17675 [Bacillaceae bacterium SIJ1]|uniref:hypothetical protein n=1 Tax=Litoribacterium kuwaitense TaxID=1398745 RepID=UPI0013EA207E|nr:hypothetical protein [Litoribacterium kuwaitense]NGP46685.1 hypothetical protein [Litoribacterium kuwaitense]
MSLPTILKWVTGVIEAGLGIPFIGGIFIVANGWAPLWIMLVVHVVVLLINRSHKKRIIGPAFGIGASLLGFIPVVGMISHIVAAIVLLIDAYVSTKEEK